MAPKPGTETLARPPLSLYDCERERRTRGEKLARLFRLLESVTLENDAPKEEPAQSR